MNFPASVSIKAMNSKHSSIDASKTEKYSALYGGGSLMTDKMKEQIIIRRQNEVLYQPEVFRQRIKRSYYINRAGGVIDYICSNATADTPRIMVGKNANDEQRNFWLTRSVDCDGMGTPFASIFRQLLKDELVTCRPYIKIDIEPEEQEINITRLDPAMVVDWGISEEGEPWIKTHAVNILKKSPFESEELIENIWTIFTPTDSVVYRAYNKKDNNQLFASALGDKFENDAKAQAILDKDSSVYNHDFGMLPIFKATPQWWLMDRLSENICALYNAESDLAWVISQSAYPQGILKLESEARFQALYNKSEAAIWNLLPSEDYKIISSSGVDFEAQFKNVDRLKISLHESMQMMAKEASTIPQAGRLSGEAVREMRSPMDALLQSFLWPILDVCYEAIEAIKSYRNEEDLAVWIEGLNINADETALRKLLLGEEEEEVEDDSREQARNNATNAAASDQETSGPTKEERTDTESGQ